MIKQADGVLLIAEPFLKDPSFMRTVVLLCRHNEEGSFGFTLTNAIEPTLDQLVHGFDNFPLTVFQGGPVQLDTIHFIHQYPQIPDAQKVTDQIYWGGDFEALKHLINSGEVDTDKVRFFLGYSGWSEGQLDAEMDEHTWLTLPATAKIVFGTSAQEIWKSSVLALGGQYKQMVNFPTDPQLN